MERYIEFCSIGKAYPGVQALKDVRFKVRSGKICALLGENGAGKSTLLKILSGDLQPDEGFITINGEQQKFVSPSQAIKASVSVIYQETQLVTTLSVMENVFIECLPKNKFGFLDRARLRKETHELIEKFGLPFGPTDTVGRLSMAHQQMVEIMKAIRRNSNIIAFDEPTASLTDTEITILFKMIEKLKEEGKVIIYVSHRMGEIFQLTDEIVVLKDGRLIKTFNTKETSEKILITAMVGRDIGDTYASLRRNNKIGDVLLEVNNLVTDDVFDVSFKLRRGEIVGLAGLIGAGRTEVVRAIFGADPIISGEIKIDGEIMNFKSPTEAIEAGIALCPEDRKWQGLVLWQTITKNITMPILKKVRKGRFLDFKMERKLAEAAVEKYSIKTTSVDKLVSELSGGNQQKVILGRWTSEMMDMKILILDEPTKGIDVGTKAEIYQMICDFAMSGIGVIFISSELTEVINVADTIVVMQNGQVTGSVAREEATEENVLALAMLN